MKFDLKTFCAICRAESVFWGHGPTEAADAAIAAGWGISRANLLKSGRIDFCPAHYRGDDRNTAQFLAQCYNCEDDFQGTETECERWRDSHYCAPDVAIYRLPSRHMV